MARSIHTLILLISVALRLLGSSEELEQCQTTSASNSSVLWHMVYHLCNRSAWFLSEKSRFSVIHLPAYGSLQQTTSKWWPQPLICINFLTELP